jgi:hypothetical protein
MKAFLIGLVALSSASTFACEQKGLIKEIKAAGDYIHFKLDNGFNLKQDKNSSTVQVLLHASATSREVCANGLLQNVSNKTWGRATEVLITNL